MKQGLMYSVVNHPWRVIFASLLVMVAFVMGGQELAFRGDYKIFFAQDNKQLQDFEQMQRTFTKSDNVSVVIEPKSKNIYSKETLTLVWELTDALWQAPFSTRVDSLTNYQHTEAEEDDLIVEDLVLDPEYLDAKAIDKVKRVSSTEPLLLHRTVSEEGHVTMINVTMQMPDKVNLTGEVVEVAAFMRQEVEKFKAKYPDHNFYLSGNLMMNNAFFEQAQLDSQTLIPAMFGAILLMLAILLRSVLATFATLVVIIVANVITVGLMLWLGLYMSTVTVNAPTIIMTLAVADAVHVIASMSFFMRKGDDRPTAVAKAVELNIMPIFITSVTTAIGFLTFNFSDVPPIQELGNLVAFGVMVAFVLSITLLPAMLRLLPIKVKNDASQSTFMDHLGDFVVRSRKWLLPASAVVMIGISALIPQNTINDIATEYFDSSVPFRQASDFTDENLMGVTMIEFAVDTKQASGINSPEFLNTLESFSLWLRDQKEVDHVLTLSDTFKRLNKNMHNDEQAFYTLPQDRELAAQYLLLYEMSLPYGLDLNNQLNVDKSSLRMTINIDNVGSKEIVAIEELAKQWFAKNAPQYNLMASSPSLMFAHIGERNMKSMILGTTVALLLISVLLIFALKDVRLGLISLIPNLAPAAVGFGIWSLWSGNVNLGLSVVTSMTLGIVVDDAVHFLSKYKRAREEGNNPEEAVRFAFSSVGRALLITTLVLVIGFLVLAQSTFAVNGDMGLLSAIIIFFALVVDFLFLPPFLILLDNKEYPAAKGESHETQRAN